MNKLLLFAVATYAPDSIKRKLDGLNKAQKEMREARYKCESIQRSILEQIESDQMLNDMPEAKATAALKDINEIRFGSVGNGK